jgi:hypothetical protein
VGRPPLNSKAMTDAERKRRSRAHRRAHGVGLRRPKALAVSQMAKTGAEDMGYSEIANEVLGAAVDKLRERLQRSDSSGPLKFVLGYRVAMEEAIATIEHDRNEIFKFWGKPASNLRRPSPDAVETIEPTEAGELTGLSEIDEELLADLDADD